MAFHRETHGVLRIITEKYIEINIYRMYTEKKIDLNKLLTINFNSRATIPLVDSGDNFIKKNEVKNEDIIYILPNKPFWGTNINYKVRWDEIFDKPFKYKKYHTITVNWDPSLLGYQNDIRSQKEMLFNIIYEYVNKIKYLALIYEHGRGKLHWHMLLNIQSIKEFEESLRKKFGKERAVYIKKVQENNSETLEQNLRRILEYFKKEDHNKELCLLSKI